MVNIPFLKAFARKKVLSETSVKEHQVFHLRNHKLNTALSKEQGKNVLVGGLDDGAGTFQPLLLSIVSSDKDKDPASPSTKVLYENYDYRVRVSNGAEGGGRGGYLRVEDPNVHIVENYKAGSKFRFFGAAGWGIRVATDFPGGYRLAFSAAAPGEAVTLELASDEDQQRFEIVPVESPDQVE
ncbi:hypothetical protein BG004_002569 [Podila humilis]|nr:hypothetical protein BG004_002569 [Podila humilis]